MKNSAGLGGCYPPRPKAKVDNSTLRDLQNSSYPTKAEFSNYFVIYSKYLYNKIYILLKEKMSFILLKFCTLQQYRSKIISCPGFLGQWFNNLQWTALLTSLPEYDKILCKFGQQQLVTVNYASGYNQSEMGKYFELIINKDNELH